MARTIGSIRFVDTIHVNQTHQARIRLVEQGSWLAGKHLRSAALLSLPSLLAADSRTFLLVIKFMFTIFFLRPTDISDKRG
jgi:hypothetical protein